MKFQIGDLALTVDICPGGLREDGRDIDAITHDGVVLISGLLSPNKRIRVLVDQLWQMTVCLYGCPPSSIAVSTFTLDFMRQLRQQGGKRAIERMVPRPVVSPIARRAAA